MSKISPRRNFVLRSVVVCGTVLLLPHTSLATDEFDWINPGENRYTRTPEYAVRGFNYEAGLLPAEAPDEFLAKMAIEDYSVEEIPPDFRFHAMYFGDGEIRQNVIARTREWPVGVTREADVYRLQRGRYQYTVFRPHICDNWGCVSRLMVLDCLAPEDMV